MQNLTITNLILLVISAIYVAVLIPSLYLKLRGRHHGGLVSSWLALFLITGLMLPFLAFFSGHFWFYLGYGTLGFTVITMLFSFGFIISLMKDHSGSGALIAPIMFNWFLSGFMIIAHLIFH